MIALAIVLAGGWHNSLRHALADLRFAWQSRQVSGDIVVIAIDASSIDRIGVWPWPRLLHAELIRQLQKADVLDIALDVDFSTQSTRGKPRPPTRRRTEISPKPSSARADRSCCPPSSSPAPTG
jgi:CHASE2 domain-containing sensor protein